MYRWATTHSLTAPQNLTYSLHEAGVVMIGGINSKFQPGMEAQSIIGTPVG